MNRGLPPEDWDQRLQERGGSLLQSRVWAEFQQALGRKPVWAEGDDWQWVAALRGSHGLRYLMSPYGPAADTAVSMRSAIQKLTEAGRGLAADFVRIEPQHNVEGAELHRLGGRQIAEADPQHTIVIELTKDEASLRSMLASGHRNLINGTERRGVTIRQTTDPVDFELFLRMLDDTARHSNVKFYPSDYYRQLYKSLDSQGYAKLYLADTVGEPVAAALFYDWGGTRYYAHAGAFQEANRQAKASVSLVWQALLDAKAAGMQHFDLWGTAPAGDEEHSLAGITRFKAAFGGERVEYAGTWDIPLRPWKYDLYSMYRRLRGRT